MALINKQDGQKHINDFNANGDIIAQNWTDSMGQKNVKEMLEVSNYMNDCMQKIKESEAVIRQVTDLFLQECGGSASASDADYDLLDKMVKEIFTMLNELTDSGDSDTSGGGSHISMSSESDGKSDSVERRSNLDGTMLGGAPVYYQDDSEEYTQGHSKTKRR